MTKKIPILLIRIYPQDNEMDLTGKLIIKATLGSDIRRDLIQLH